MEKKSTVVNIKEIAEALNLSTTTVSRVFSGNGRIGEETKQRVHAYMDQMGYVPNVYSKTVKAKKSKIICVVLPLEEDYAELPYFQKILVSIYDVLIANGYYIMIAKTALNDITALKNVVNEHSVDGVILTRTMDNGLDIHFLQQKNIPFVVAGSYADPNVLQVDADQLNGCCDLTTAILRMGIRKIALFMSEKAHVVNQNRFRGFVKAYEQCGLDIDRTLVFENMGYPSVAADYALKMVNQGVECIICMDDNICLYVLNELRKHHIEVPRDIKIASFYNSRLLDEYYPAISCVEFDTRKQGSMAAKVLIDRINGDMEPKKFIIGYSVVLKDSTK